MTDKSIQPSAIEAQEREVAYDALGLAVMLEAYGGTGMAAALRSIGKQAWRRADAIRDQNARAHQEQELPP